MVAPAHICVFTVFSAAGCPDGCVRHPRKRGPRTASRRQPRPTRPPEPWSITTLDLFRSDRRYRISSDRPAGLDCGLRYPDIVRMTMSQAGLVRACLDNGWPSTEDVVGEVVLRVVRRQTEGKPYDPTRSSVGRYLFLICTSILRNLADLRRADEKVTGDGEVPRGARLTLADVIEEAEASAPVPPPRATRVGQVVRRRDCVNPG